VVIAHHIGNQPTRVARLEDFFIGHDQANAGAGLDTWTPGAQAMTFDYPTRAATGRAPPSGLERLDAFIDALVAQTGYGVGNKAHRGHCPQTGKLDTNNTRQGKEGRQSTRAGKPVPSNPASL
jgi:hypothetical protein